ncbi:FAD-dependent oxidoreductase [Cellulomonas cellasea]|uniref:FAD-dependent oxidoreductase n=1 Tax=Cellulomonas cellasea TaxID=43670 RepID=UPI0025A380AA|nr:FAD-dependent oxidoreductase [Cellulomonas cellasea]MDM8084313.1 FAD-dependent oxidoreductase [Cellulomonas cellasea]
MRRVVVVGNGMVGSRFVAELVRRDPGVSVTVLGAEEYEPYNRVLLSEVVAGAVEMASLALPRPPVGGVRVRAGAQVTSIDRERRQVVTADGEVVDYDALVLATGARAVAPPTPGLLRADSPARGATHAHGDMPAGPALVVGAHALRTLDDAREIVAATLNARDAVVVGAGVLGVEVACGLARRGLRVTVVHRGPGLMDRQLDVPAAEALGHGLDLLGVRWRVGAEVASVLAADGRLRGVVLSDGEALAADLLVLAVGTAPETDLARGCGLAVDRGIVVDSHCGTSDPRVHAIGDCAQPPGGGHGLLAQGWDQARRLAERLVADTDTDGRAPRADDGGRADADGGGQDPGATVDVVRVKAQGLDVVSMGVSGAGARQTPGLRAVRLSDPATGRHVEVVVGGGVVVGATCVGAGPVAADLVSAYTRRTPVPADPAHLLLRPARGAAADEAASPLLMPDRATVCRCNGVTKGDLVASWRGGARTVADVARDTRATSGCGGCRDAVCGLLEWLERSDPQDPAPGRPVSQDQGAAASVQTGTSRPDG